MMMKDYLLGILARLYPMSLLDRLHYYDTVIRSFKYASKLHFCGNGTRFGKVEFATGLEQHIEVGQDTVFLPHLHITTWRGENASDIKLVIGNRCSFGSYCHLSAANKITIGDNVLTGKWVTIIDNDHGSTDKTAISLPPLSRPIYSKGTVTIGDNVWIGDKVTILAGVAIGARSIIGAGSVVTKSIPADCIAAGNPCRVIRKM